MFKDFFSIFDRKGTKVLLVFVGLLLVAGTVFYNSTEHWGWFNALYFSVITLTTVGYGDLEPHSTASKAFTIIYLLVGVGIILSFINHIANHTRQSYEKRTETYLDQIEKYIKTLLEKALKRPSP